MLRKKLVTIRAKVTWRAKYVTFQLAELAVPRRFFAAILDRIAQLAMPPTLIGRCDGAAVQRVENEVPCGEDLRKTDIFPLKNDLPGTDSQFPASDA